MANTSGTNAGLGDAERAAVETGKTPARALMTEVGYGGTRMAGGYVSADFRPELNGQRGAEFYDEMRKNDPVIHGILFAVTMLCRRVAWTVDPAREDETQPATPEAVKVAGIVRRIFFDEMRTPFVEMVAECLTMVPFGYAVLEVVYRKAGAVLHTGAESDGQERTDYVGVEAITMRPQTSIERWVTDPITGEIKGFYQRPASDYGPMGLVFVPYDKVIHPRTTSEANNPEGVSFLRGAYKYYRRKLPIEEGEGRAAIRAGGLVVTRIPGKYLDSSADQEEQRVAQSFKQLTTQLSEDRMGGITLPSDVDPNTKALLYDIEYKVADGRRSADFSALITRMDQRIAASILADFIMLGQGANGSWALSADKTGMFAQAIQALLDVIASELNRKVIRRLAAFNQWRRDVIPTIRPGEISPIELGALSAYLTSLAAAEQPLANDPKLAAHLRRRGGMPEPDPKATSVNATQAKTAADFAPPPPPLAAGGAKPGAAKPAAPRKPVGTRPAVALAKGEDVVRQHWEAVLDGEYGEKLQTEFMKALQGERGEDARKFALGLLAKGEEDATDE